MRRAVCPTAVSAQTHSSQYSDSFGEKVLGTGASNGGGGGDWRAPAKALLSFFRLEEREGPPAPEAQPEEVEGFFRELGLEPTPMISKR